MSVLHLVLGCVALQRCGELVLAARNTRALRAAGAIELDPRGYPLFFLLHAAWLCSLAVFVPASAAPSWPLVAVFVLFQFGRLWVIVSLGRCWTTRLMILPKRPLVTRGPYRFLNHPNYLIVAGEIAVLPLAFGAAVVAAVFSAANLALIGRRIAIEERALAPRRGASARTREPSPTRNPAPRI